MLTPERVLWLLRRVIPGLFRWLFSIELRGWQHYPHDAPRLLIVANHVSFLDGILLSAYLPDVPVFVINTRMAARWWIKPFIRMTRHINIETTSPLYLKTLIRQLKTGERIAIFPEGRITVTGSLMKVYAGPVLAADRADAVLLPIHIEGAQYSLLSRLGGRLRRRVFPPIRLTMLPPVRFDPESRKGHSRRQYLDDQLQTLMEQLCYHGKLEQFSWADALITAMQRHGGSHVVVEDPQFEPLDYRTLLRRAFQVASSLSEPGSGFDGVMLTGSTRALVVILALQLRRRVPLMLAPTLTADQLESLLNQATIGCLVTEWTLVEGTELEPVLTRHADRLNVVYLDRLPRLSSIQKLICRLYSRFPGVGYRHLSDRRVTADDPALAFHAEKLDGQPVILSHRNLLARAAQWQAMQDIGPQDRVFHALPIWSGYGLVTATLIPILTGSRVFIYPSAEHSHLLAELVYDRCATVLFTTSDGLAGYDEWADSYDFFNMRRIYVTAEHLSTQAIEFCHDRFGLKPYLLYEPSDLSGLLTANSPRHNRQSGLGRPVPGLEWQPSEQNPEQLAAVRGESIAGVTAAEYRLDGPLIADERGFLTFSNSQSN